MTEFTIEIYRSDRRRKDGYRLVEKVEGSYRNAARATAEAGHMLEAGIGDYFTVRETFVTRQNYATGKEYQERYDVPYYCSPSSETFWSM